MKKNVVFIFLMVIAIFSSFNSYVFAKDVSCPAAELIKKKDFLQGVPFAGNDDGWYWRLTSDSFTYDHKAWRVFLVAWLTGQDMDQDHALQKGQEILKKANLIENPTPEVYKESISCIYIVANNYKVMVVTPPVP